MGLIDNNGYVVQLTKMFEQTKTKGTVFLTTKRLCKGGTGTPTAVAYTRRPKKGAPAVPGPTSPYSVLFRAVCGKSKISTLVTPADLSKFNQSYLGVVRAQMTTLKKKEKVKKPRGKKGAAAASGTATAAPASA